MELRSSIFLVIFVVLTGCGPSKLNIKDNNIPIYQDYISPITVPVQVEYKPTSVQFEYDIFVDSSVTKDFKTENKSNFIKMIGNTDIRSLGDLLIWDSRVTKMINNGEEYFPNKDLITVRMLTNKLGEIQEFELSSPALESSKATKKEIDDFIESAKKNMKSFSAILESNYVRSGDTIIQTNINSAFDFMKGIDRESLSENSLKWIVKGWGIYNKKQIIVTSIDNDIKFRLKGDTEGQIRVNGYTLFDPDTMQIVENKVLMAINTPDKDGNSISIKILSEGFNNLQSN